MSNTRELHIVDPDDDKKTKCGRPRNSWTFASEEMNNTVREHLAVVITTGVPMAGCEECCDTVHHQCIDDWNQARNVERALAGTTDDELPPALPGHAGF